MNMYEKNSGDNFIRLRAHRFRYAENGAFACPRRQSFFTGIFCVHAFEE
jgi:hypothetical protein